MARLKITLLGHFTVALDDAPVEGFAYDKVRALLAYLAVEAGTPHHREVLADLLWPGYPERSARQNLSQALSTLRGALGDRDTETPFLHSDHREVQFNPADSVWLDVRTLAAHLNAVHTHPHAALGSCAECLARLEEAAALYRGDFLADLLVDDSPPFEEWALLQRENMRRQMLDALDRLAESRLQHDDAEAALRYARRQLELDAWRESAHRQVMRALVLRGQRTSAIAHYEDCRRALAEGLGVEPEAATLELAHMLKSNTLLGGGQTAGLPSTDADLVGRVVGNYLVVEHLGHGGMAQVYKAYHTRLARYVALKFIRQELLEPTALRAFEQEAKTLARLNHPNVIQVYDFGELDDATRHPYLVLEYVTGENLADWLPGGEALPLAQVWPILQQVSAALDYAHEHGVIHRDIKPGNVMLTPDGHALLGDFGISKLLRPGEDAAHTVAATGTPAYMAPEQVDRGIGPVSAATDVYALGIVTYEMLTGQRPFAADTAVTEMLRRVQVDPTPPRHYCPDLPIAVEQVLLKALARDPAARYPTAGAFIQALAVAAPEALPGAGEQLPAWWPQLSADLAPAPGEAPFKGLEHFNVSDADLFFGREALVTRLVRYVAPVAPHDQRAGKLRFLAIVGASGSGKSSLVRAGLVATLLRGEVVAAAPAAADAPPYAAHILTPTAHPLENLALTLTQESESVTAAATLMDDLARDPRSLRLFLKKQGAGDKKQESTIEHPASSNQPLLPTPYSLLPTLLVVDQFEEVFTLCRDAGAREAFIANLLTAAQLDGDAGAFVVITLRADFYDHCAHFPTLREAVSQHQVYIGPMTADGLRHAIEEPAERAGWAFEPGLVDLLLRDVGAGDGHQPEPGALPLLSHALLETWKRRRRRTLTLGGYAEAGGVRGAIAKTAEAVYRQLDAAQQGIARNIFLRLTELGEGTQDTRRRVTLIELRSHGADAASVDAVLAQLADARLVTTERETAQVAHEALIREWPTLRGWLEADREGLRLHRHLTEAAQAWEGLQRDPGELYRGARLAQAAEWAAAHPAALNALEREFLEASQVEAERAEAEQEAQRQRELEAARKLAETEKARAEESRAAARKLRVRARYLGVAAVVILFAAIAAVLMWNQARLTAQENATLAGENANIAATAVAVGELEAAARVEAEAARVEADEQRIAAEEAEHEALLQASVGLASRALDELSGVPPVRAVLLALAALEEYPYTPQAESALARAVGENRPYVIMQDSGGTRYPFRVAWSPDGRYVAAGRFLGADIAVIWDAETGQIVQRFPWDELRTQQCQNAYIAWSPTGDRMVIFTSHETLAMCRSMQIWDVTTGRNLLFAPTDYGPEAFGAGWTPDGTQVFSAFTDGTVKIWDIVRPGVHSSSEITLTEHLSFTIAERSPSVSVGQKGMVVWSPVEEYFAVAVAWQNQAQIVDAATSVGLLNLVGHTAGLSDITWAPDGARIATSSEDGTVRVWDTTSGEVLLTLSGHGSGAGRGGVMSVAWSPDGARIASTGGDRTARIWNAANGAELLRYYGVTSPWDVEWSPSGDRLVIRGADEIRVLDMSTESIRLYSPDQSANVEVVDAQYSSNGKYIVTSSGRLSGIKMWDAYNGAELVTLAANVTQYHVAWAPDSARIAAGGNPLHVWEAASGNLLLQIPTVEGAWFHTVSWSPDGTQVLGSRAYGDYWRVYVFNAATGDNLLAFGEYGGFKYAEWSPDGKYIATGCVYSADGNCPSRIWDAQTGETLLMLEGAGSDTYFLEWSPDGKWLATAHTGGIVTVWDTATGQARLVFAGHDEWITDVTWSPDGTRCASGDVAGTVKGWDAFTGAEVFSFQSPGGVERMDWAPDGAHLVVAGQFDAPIIYRVWQSTEDLIEYARECCVFRALTAEERAQFMLEAADHE